MQRTRGRGPSRGINTALGRRERVRTPGGRSPRRHGAVPDCLGPECGGEVGSNGHSCGAPRAIEQGRSGPLDGVL